MLRKKKIIIERIPRVFVQISSIEKLLAFLLGAIVWGTGIA